MMRKVSISPESVLVYTDIYPLSSVYYNTDSIDPQNTEPYLETAGL